MLFFWSIFEHVDLLEICVVSKKMLEKMKEQATDCFSMD